MNNDALMTGHVKIGNDPEGYSEQDTPRRRSWSAHSKRALAGLAVVVTASVGLTIGVTGTSQAATGAQAMLPSGTYVELRSQGSDNCLSVDGRGPGGPGADLADVVQYHCEGSLNQHWKRVDAGSGYFELRAQNSNKCLSVDGRGPGGPGADLADVVQYHCEGTLNQHWLQVDAGSGQFELRAQNSNKCLSVDGRGPGGPGADLANVVQYHCEGGALNQHWRAP